MCVGADEAAAELRDGAIEPEIRVLGARTVHSPALRKLDALSTRLQDKTRGDMQLPCLRKRSRLSTSCG